MLILFQSIGKYSCLSFVFYIPVPNGGYVLAIAGRVLREALPHKDPLTVNAYYLAPTDLGPIDCRVELLRAGRNTTHAEVKMYQGGELKVQVTAAYTSMDHLQGENWSRDSRPEIPSWEQSPSGTGNPIELRERVDLRIIEGAEVFTGGARTLHRAQYRCGFNPAI